MKKGKKIKEDIDKPVFEHLKELRTRLVIIFLSLLAVTIFCYFKTPMLINILKKPIQDFNIKFAFFNITGAFTTRLKLALITSLVALSPLVYYQLMAFVAPGLTVKERKLVNKSFFLVVPMFVVGVVFGYVLIIPKALNFLIAYGSSYMNPIFSGEKYLSFIALLCVLIGIVAAIPVVFIFMARLGILSSVLLKKIRKFVIFTILIGEGIIVGDLMSFILLGLPFILIYEISLGIVILIEKKRANMDTKHVGESCLGEIESSFCEENWLQCVCFLYNNYINNPCKNRFAANLMIPSELYSLFKGAIDLSVITSVFSIAYIQLESRASEKLLDK